MTRLLLLAALAVSGLHGCTLLELHVGQPLEGVVAEVPADPGRALVPAAMAKPASDRRRARVLLDTPADHGVTVIEAWLPEGTWMMKGDRVQVDRIAQEYYVSSFSPGSCRASTIDYSAFLRPRSRPLDLVATKSNASTAQ